MKKSLPIVFILIVALVLASAFFMTMDDSTLDTLNIDGAESDGRETKSDAEESDGKEAKSDATETESDAVDTKSDASESDATEQENDVTESDATEPHEETESDAEEITDDPLEKDISQGVSLRTFVNRVIEIALNEPTNPVVDGETKYGELFGHPTEAWCTEFVMYCIKQAEDELGTKFIWYAYPWKDNASSVGLWYKRHDRYYEPDGSYIPVGGDIVLFDTVGRGYPDHTGLVIGTEEDETGVYIITIEGNIPGDKPKVIRSRRLKVTDESIVCYGSCYLVTEYTGDKEWY